MSARDRVLGVASLLLTAVLAPLIAWLILRPVNKAGGRLHAPTRFLLIDFVWLLVELQLSLGFCLQYIGIQYRQSFLMLLGFLTFALLAMWGGAVSFLSRAGVRSSLKRGAFILILLPATLVMMVVVPIFPAICYLLERDPRMMELVLRLKFSVPAGMGQTIALIGAVVLPTLMILLNRLSAWIVRGASEVAMFRQPVAA